jgi:cobalt-zinc-cadmium efflux system outer membrane protein
MKRLTMKVLIYLWALLSCVASEGEECGYQPMILNFDEATKRVLNQSLRLKMLNFDIQSKASEFKQSTLYPNPILSCELDEIGREGWSGESNWSLSQFVELGGKRQIRQNLASYQYHMALIDYKSSQIELLNILTKRFIDVIASQEKLLLAIEERKLAEQFLFDLSEKLEYGKICLMDYTKGEMIDSMARLKEEQAYSDFIVAKKQLAILWGCPTPDFQEVSYPFFYELEIPCSLSDYLSFFYNKPELMRAHLDHLAAQEVLKMEKSRQVPDVTMTLGYTIDRDKRDHGLLVGVSLPLPIFDRNQGNISRAYVEMFKIEEQSKLLHLKLESQFSIAHREFVQAYDGVEKFRKSILKSANHLCQLAEQGYREGKFHYLERLQAEQTLFEIKEKYIEILVNYHYKKADIEYLNIE